MRALRAYLSNRRGSAAIEFALVLGMLTIPLMSVIDLGMYTYDKMQVRSAAQVAAQSVWASCGSSSNWPVTRYCTSWQSGINTSAQLTSLATNVTVTSVVDGYYCVNGSGILTAIGSTGTFASPLTATAPTSCGSGTWETTTPYEFVTVTVSYTYAPVFGGISVASLLPTSMTATSTMQVK